jgi:hypothetical protein
MSLKYLPVASILMAAALSVANGQQARFNSFEVRSCHFADSLLGLDTDKTAGHIIALTTPDSSLRIFSIEPRPFMRGATGIVEIGGTLRFTRATPEQLPPFQFELKAISPLPRSIEDRQLTFTLDDTTQVEAGTMAAALQHWPGVTDAVENMAIVLPFHRLTQLAKAREVRGHLGQTAFSVSPSQLANMRSLVVAALCYTASSE